jgi:hypothetical protein
MEWESQGQMSRELTSVSVQKQYLEVRVFDTGLGDRISSVYVILPAALGPGIYSASKRNQYQKKKRSKTDKSAICEPIA